MCSTSPTLSGNLIGWGTENSKNYFILRMQWGTSWGEEGYMRIQNNGDGNGVCGIFLNAVYVVV